MTKKLLKSETPAENTTHVHNHQPSYAGLLLIAAIITGVIVLGVYHWILAGLAELGFVNPKATLFFAAFGGAFLIVFALTGSYLVNWQLNQHHQRKLKYEDAYYRRLELQHRIQASVVADTRELNPAIKRRNALIIQLMLDALHGKQNFSYRKAGEYVLTGETKKAGKDSVVVREALEWLRDNGAIDGNDLTDKYTSIGDVQRALYNGILLK